MTTNEIRSKITTDQRWLERAIVALFEKQTAIEQRIEDARELNGVGFNKPDSHRMSYYAKWILSGKHLSGKFLADAQHRVKKYAAQLAKIAEEKARRRVA